MFSRNKVFSTISFTHMAINTLPSNLSQAINILAGGHYISHKDLLNFAVSNKSMREASLSAIQQHVTFRDKTSNYTPLHEAASTGDTNRMLYLISTLKMDTNKKDINGYTPLYVAARYSRLNAIQLLLAQGASLESKSNIGMTPFLASCYHGHTEVAKYLLKAGAKKNVKTDEGFRMIHCAVISGNADLVCLAVVETGKRCVHRQTNDGASPMTLAIRRGSIDIAKTLWTNGVDFEEIPKIGLSALHVACLCERSAEMMQYLLSGHTPVNIKNKKGVTALHYAAAHGKPSVVSTLCVAGADHYQECNKGRAAIHCAAYRGNLQVLRWLLANHFYVDQPSKCSCTPLHFAAESGHVEVVQELLSQGANVNATSCRGQTPLVWSIKRKKAAAAQLLIQNGADISLYRKNKYAKELQKLIDNK